jgi:hypothetical protein
MAHTDVAASVTAVNKCRSVHIGMRFSPLLWRATQVGEQQFEHRNAADGEQLFANFGAMI